MVVRKWNIYYCMNIYTKFFLYRTVLSLFKNILCWTIIQRVKVLYNKIQLRPTLLHNVCNIIYQICFILTGISVFQPYVRPQLRLQQQNWMIQFKENYKIVVIIKTNKNTIYLYTLKFWAWLLAYSICFQIIHNQMSQLLEHDFN